MKENKKVRIPKQERSIENKRLIIEAAIELFKKKGYSNTNSKEIAATAGVSTGTFYCYFADKTDLLLEIVKTHKEQQIDINFHSIENKLAEITTSREAIYLLIKSIIETQNLPIDLLKQITALRYTDIEVAKYHQAEEETTLGLIKSFLKYFDKELKIKDLDVASKMILLVTKETTKSYTIFKPDIEKECFIFELSDMIIKYLNLYTVF